MHVKSFISAFIDDELDDVLADTVREHLRDCKECNVLHQEQVEAHAAASGTAGEVRAPADLQQRLLNLDECGAIATAYSHARGAPARPFIRPMVTLTVSTVLVVALVLFVAGSYRWSQRVYDTQAIAELGGIGTDGQVAGTDASPLLALAEVSRGVESTGGTDSTSSFALPNRLPAGLEVVGSQEFSDGRTEYVIETPAGEQLWVVEVPGRLDPADVAAMKQVRIGSHTVYKNSAGHWFIDCGRSVIHLDPQAAATSARVLVASLRAEGGADFWDKLQAGWDVITGK